MLVSGAFPRVATSLPRVSTEAGSDPGLAAAHARLAVTVLVAIVLVYGLFRGNGPSSHCRHARRSFRACDGAKFRAKAGMQT